MIPTVCQAALAAGLTVPCGEYDLPTPTPGTFSGGGGFSFPDEYLDPYTDQNTSLLQEEEAAAAVEHHQPIHRQRRVSSRILPTVERVHCEMRLQLARQVARITFAIPGSSPYTITLPSGPLNIPPV